MEREKVTTDRYVKELNSAYEIQPDYNQHNRFQVWPHNATGRSILGYHTPSIWTQAHSRALNVVSAAFEFDIENEA